MALTPRQIPLEQKGHYGQDQKPGVLSKKPNHMSGRFETKARDLDDQPW